MAHDLVFANARVKARENNILTRDKLFRMIESDLPEAFSMLSEVGYSVESADIDEICAIEEKKLVEFMKERKIIHTVRGIRDTYDYKYETTMARYNTDMYPQVITLFIPTPTDLTYISSSAIRSVINLNTDISKYVPTGAKPLIEKAVKEKF